MPKKNNRKKDINNKDTTNRDATKKARDLVIKDNIVFIYFLNQ